MIDNILESYDVLAAKCDAVVESHAIEPVVATDDVTHEFATITSVAELQRFIDRVAARGYGHVVIDGPIEPGVNATVEARGLSVRWINSNPDVAQTAVSWERGTPGISIEDVGFPARIIEFNDKVQCVENWRDHAANYFIALKGNVSTDADELAAENLAIQNIGIGLVGRSAAWWMARAGESEANRRSVKESLRLATVEVERLRYSLQHRTLPGGEPATHEYANGLAFDIGARHPDVKVQRTNHFIALRRGNGIDVVIECFVDGFGVSIVPDTFAPDATDPMAGYGEDHDAIVMSRSVLLWFIGRMFDVAVPNLHAPHPPDSKSLAEIYAMGKRMGRSLSSPVADDIAAVVKELKEQLSSPDINVYPPFVVVAGHKAEAVAIDCRSHAVFGLTFLETDLNLAIDFAAGDGIDHADVYCDDVRTLARYVESILRTHDRDDAYPDSVRDYVCNCDDVEDSST